MESQVILLIKSSLPGLGKPTPLPSPTPLLSFPLYSQSPSLSSFSKLPNWAGVRGGVGKPGTDGISFLKPPSASNEVMTDKVNIYIYISYKDIAPSTTKQYQKKFLWILNGTDK